MAGSIRIHKETTIASRLTGDNSAFLFFGLTPASGTKRRFAGETGRTHPAFVQMTAVSDASTRITPSKVAATRRTFLSFSLAAALQTIVWRDAKAAANNTTSAYEIDVNKNGSAMKLNNYKGKITLFVNVATYCALTPQYEGLVNLHDTFQPQGFEIVASPCDQFGHQEPGSNEDICKFAKEQFGATFLLLDKLNVNDGPGGVAPLYRYLRDASPERAGERLSWNFEKFLVGTDGKVLRRYKPGILPEQIRGDVEWALKHPGANLPPKKKPSLGVE